MTDEKKSAKKSAKKTAKRAAKKTAAKKATTVAKKTAVKKGTSKKAVKKATRKSTPSASEAASVAEAPKTAEPTGPRRSESETRELREALTERLEELEAERETHIADMAAAQRERLADSAGDDQVDAGSKTVEHEQELTVVRSITDRINQMHRALERLEVGDYGICEKCGKPIPAARLAVFPSATLCVDCKQLEESR